MLKLMVIVVRVVLHDLEKFSLFLGALLGDVVCTVRLCLLCLRLALHDLIAVVSCDDFTLFSFVYYIHPWRFGNDINYDISFIRS